MPTYSKETSLFKTGAIDSGIQEAGRTATNYLSQDDSGIMIYDATDGSTQSPSSATSKNVFIDSDSVDIRNGQEVLASFGSDVKIGKSTNSNVSISNNQLIFKDGVNSRIVLDSNTDGGGRLTFYKNVNDEVQIIGEIQSDEYGDFNISSFGNNSGITFDTNAVHIPAIKCDDVGFSSLFSVRNVTLLSSRSIAAGTVVNGTGIISVPSGLEILGIVGYGVDSGDINVASLYFESGPGQFGNYRTVDYNIKNLGSVSRTTGLYVQVLCVKVGFII